MHHIRSDGYSGIGDGSSIVPDDIVEAEEEGNGRAVIEDANDEEVRTVVTINLRYRNLTLI